MWGCNGYLSIGAELLSLFKAWLCSSCTCWCVCSAWARAWRKSRRGWYTHLHTCLCHLCFSFPVLVYSSAMNKLPYYSGSMDIEIDLLLWPKCFQMKLIPNLVVGFCEEACTADCCAAFTGCVCKEWALISAVLSLELSQALNFADSLNWGWWLGISQSRGLSGCWVWYLKLISPAFQKTDKVENRWGVKVVLKKSISSRKLQFNKCLDISGSNSL